VRGSNCRAKPTQHAYSNLTVCRDQINSHLYAFLSELFELLVIGLPVIPVHNGRIDICWRFEVGTHQHRNHTHQDTLDGEDGLPPESKTAYFSDTSSCGLNSSFSGACRMEMHTSPLGKTACNYCWYCLGGTSRL
jgi:hypothetical protein